MDILQLDESQITASQTLERQKLLASFFTAVRVGNTAEVHRILSALDPGVEGTDSKGGYLVPEFWASECAALMRTSSLFMRDSFEYGMKSNILNVPQLTSFPSVAWYNENATIAADKPVFGNLALTLKKLGVIMPMSNELLADSVIDVPSFLRDTYVDSASLEIDIQAFRGTGSPFTGILGTSETSKIYLGGSSSSGILGYDEITWDDIYNLVLTSLPPKAMRGAKLYIDQNVAAVLMKSKASVSGDYFIPLLNAPSPEAATGADSFTIGHFLNVPIVVVPSGVLIETYDTSDHADTPFCVFANLKRTTGFADPNNVSVLVSEHATSDGVSAFTNDLKLWRFTQRIALGVKLPQYIGVLSTAAS